MLVSKIVTSTYKCDWCEIEVKHDKLELPPGWITNHGDPPIGEHYCSKICNSSAINLWDEAFEVSTNFAGEWYTEQRLKILRNDDPDAEPDPFDEELDKAIYSVKLLLKGIHSQDYSIPPWAVQTLVEADLRLDALKDGLKKN